MEQILLVVTCQASALISHPLVKAKHHSHIDHDTSDGQMVIKKEHSYKQFHTCQKESNVTCIRIYKIVLKQRWDQGQTKAKEWRIRIHVEDIVHLGQTLLFLLL